MKQFNQMDDAQVSVNKGNVSIDTEYFVSAVAMERKSKYSAFLKVENAKQGTIDYLYGEYFSKSGENVLTQMTEWGKTHLQNCTEGLTVSPEDYWEWANQVDILKSGNAQYEYDKRMGAKEIDIPNVEHSIVVDIRPISC